MSAPTIGRASSTDDVRSRSSIYRLSWAIFLVGIAAWAPVGGTTLVMLPSLVEDYSPGHKVVIVGVLSAAAAILAFLANIVVGALSDRTRGRLGRRNPWILAGGTMSVASLVFLSLGRSLTLLAIGFLLLMVSANVIQGALSPVIPDRVPDRRKGLVSTAMGGGVLIGMTLGAVTGAAFEGHASTGFLALAAYPLVFAPTFLRLAPDFATGDDPRPAGPISVRATFTFPRNVPDFYYAFYGRLLVILGYNVVSGYQLFILTDYVDLTKKEATALVGAAAVVNVIGAIIGSLLGGPLSDRIGKRKIVTIISSVVIGMGVLFPIVAASPWAFLVSIGIAGLGLGMFLSVDAALLAELLPSQAARGRDLGILAMATSVGQLLGPLAGSVVVALGLGFAPIFVLGFVFCAGGAALLQPIKSVR